MLKYLIALSRARMNLDGSIFVKVGWSLVWTATLTFVSRVGQSFGSAWTLRQRTAFLCIMYREKNKSLKASSSGTLSTGNMSIQTPVRQDGPCQGMVESATVLSVSHTLPKLIQQSGITVWSMNRNLSEVYSALNLS